MSQTTILTGMVLSVMPVGEYDRRILILTRERGKVSAFARGARRQNSALMAGTSPFSFGQFEVYEGRSAYTVVKVNISNYFRELSEDLDAAYYGFYFLEMAAWYTQENMDGTDFLNLLYLTMKALLSDALDNRLVRRIFELRVLVLFGEYPNVFSCMKCGKKEGLHYFSIARHGTLCAECLRGERAVPLDESTRYALQYIITSPLEKLYTFGLSAEVFRRLDGLLSDYIKKYHGHAFKSLEILEEITGA